MGAAEQKLRLFVALPIPGDVQGSLAAVSQELRAQLPPRTVRWTPSENLHLTLRFLGDVPTSRKEALTASLETATAGFGPLHLTAERAGCFPDTRSPRVLWIGVHDAVDRLAVLHQRILTATEGFTSEPVEKAFLGHVTLGRLRQINRPQAQILARFVSDLAHRRCGEWTAARIQLMRSELSPGGSRYSSLVELPL